MIAVNILIQDMMKQQTQQDSNMNPLKTQGIARPMPLTMPVVIASLRPKALPIAITVSPTSRSEEFPNTSGLR
jgi:hypothetical protein